MEDKHTNVAQLDKYTVELTLVLTRPRWIFEKETAVVVIIWNMKAARVFVIIFGSTLSLWCYR